jgi:hypothetical protein
VPDVHLYRRLRNEQRIRYFSVRKASGNHVHYLCLARSQGHESGGRGTNLETAPLRELDVIRSYKNLAESITISHFREPGQEIGIATISVNEAVYVSGAVCRTPRLSSEGIIRGWVPIADRPNRWP